MPKKKQPQCLKSGCLIRVIVTLVNTCKGRCVCDSAQIFQEIRKYVQEIPYFLADQLMDKLMTLAEMTADDELVKNMNLGYVFHPECREISLMTSPPMSLIQEIFERMGDLGKLKRLSSRSYVRGSISQVGVLPNLTCMKLPGLKLDKSIIAQMSQDCRHLQEVEFVCPITRDEILLLSKCVHIRIFNIVTDSMMDEDALLVLDTFPKLKFFNVPSPTISGVLQKCERTYLLRNFVNILADPELSTKVLLHFPFLRKLCVRKRQVSDSLMSLNGLLHMENLCVMGTCPELSQLIFPRVHTLNVTARCPFDVLFNTVQLHNLTNLGINSITEVDLSVIGLLCPNLREITMTRCRFIPNFRNLVCSHVPFAQLLKLSMFDNDTVLPKHMHYILSSAHDLSIIRMTENTAGHSLTDDFLKNIIMQYPLKQLGQLFLESNQLSSEAVMTILERAGSEMTLVHLSGTMLQNLPVEFKDNLVRRLHTYQMGIFICDVLYSA